MFKLRTPKQETRARDRTKTGCTDERLTRAQQDPLPQETITSCKEDARVGYISEKGEPLVLHRPSCPLNGTIIGVRGCSGSGTILPTGCDHRFSRSHLKTLRTRKTKNDCTDQSTHQCQTNYHVCVRVESPKFHISRIHDTAWQPELAGRPSFPCTLVCLTIQCQNRKKNTTSVTQPPKCEVTVIP